MLSARSQQEKDDGGCLCKGRKGANPLQAHQDRAIPSAWAVICHPGSLAGLGRIMPSVALVCVSIPGHSPVSPALPHLLGGNEGGGSGGAKNESPAITTPLSVLLLALIILPTPLSTFKVPDISSECPSSAPIYLWFSSLQGKNVQQ